jgi:RimJ/RimL family protein N-acetyltransferase
MSIIFYCLQAPYQIKSELVLADGYHLELWRPSLSTVIPPGQGLFPFSVWWIMHHLCVFRNRDYGVVLIHKDGLVVHRSLVTPGYFRFPFMTNDDLQIGYVWTSPEHRAKRLATYALQEIVKLLGQAGRRFWYICEDGNLASRKVAENVGFMRWGEGVREARIFMKVFGSYKISHFYGD